MIELSIIIPVYNVKEYLTECVESIIAGDAGFEDKIEVLLMDDGSTDGSGEIADSFALGKNYIQVIHQQNQGVAAARNRGIERASGKWLFFVDSDDRIAKDALAIILQTLKANRKADILLFDAWKSKKGREKEWVHFKKEGCFDKSSQQGQRRLKLIRNRILYPDKTPMAACWDKIYRSDFLKNNGIRFREELLVLDDMIFNMEAFTYAGRVVYKKEKIYHYRRVSTSITNRYHPDRVEQDKKVWRYIEQYLERNRSTLSFEAYEELEQSYYCRIIKSFSICCRLYFFHPGNNRKWREQLSRVKKVLGEYPYTVAFNRVKPRRLQWRLKAVLMMVRGKFTPGIWFLHKVNQWMRL